MKSSETAHCLYATVSSWRYACDLPNYQKIEERAEPRLHLDGVINECTDFLEALPLGVCLVCNEGEAGLALLVPWQLLIAASDEPPLPTSLEAVLTVPETSLRDLKDCLLLTANSIDCSVKITLSVQEIARRDSDNDVAERSFSIVDFGYVLEHERKNI